MSGDVMAGSWPADRIAVCVCTAFRPKMLEACLLSLREQLTDASLFLEVVVVDNEPEPNNAEAVESIAYGSVYPMHYVHEPRRGIAFARNAALDKALELGAGWIAFIDDDETADPDWIAQLMREEYRAVAVLMGCNLPVYPEPRPFWAPEDDAPKGFEGQACKTAYTGNVRFSAELARLGMRFDECHGAMGGEDNEFFARAHAAGWGIRLTLRAITRETVHAERITYRGQIYREYRCAASEMRRLAFTRGWLGAAARKAHTIPLNLVLGVVWLVAAGFVGVVSREAFRHAALTGGKKLAKGLGRAAAFLRQPPQPCVRAVGVLIVRTSRPMRPRCEWFWIALGFVLWPVAALCMWLRR